MIRIDDLVFGYGYEGFRLEVPHLEIHAGERVAIVGRSGSGKSTLLQLISGVILPQRGSIQVDGQLVSRFSDAQRRAFRISTIGFVFQEFELVDYLTTRDNIRLPYLISRALRWNQQSELQLQVLAEACGLTGLMNRFPGQLSQGERQRVAVCRSLIAGPKLILADEPTGSLDAKTGNEVLELLLQQCTRVQATLLMVTHDLGFASRLDRTLNLAEFEQAPVPTGGR